MSAGELFLAIYSSRCRSCMVPCIPAWPHAVGQPCFQNPLILFARCVLFHFLGEDGPRTKQKMQIGCNFIHQMFILMERIVVVACSSGMLHASNDMV